jgi:hypothetical protein
LDRRFSGLELCHNRTDPLPTRQRFQTKNHLRKLVPSADYLLVNKAHLNRARDGFAIHDLLRNRHVVLVVSVGALPPVKSMDPRIVRSGSDITSVAGPNGDAQLYER